MNDNFYTDEYLPKMHRLGRLTCLLGAAASFLPAIVLAVVFGLLPKGTALLTAFLAGAGSFAVLWFLEPISYFTVLGPIGTYLAFLSGNISNMRIPCAAMAQVSTGAKPGTPQGSVTATLGMAVSIVINVCVLTIGVLLGSSVLSLLPASVTEALNYLLPALFGALLVQFAVNAKAHSAIILAWAVLLQLALKAGLFSWLPGASNYLSILASVFASVAVGLLLYRRSGETEAA